VTHRPLRGFLLAAAGLTLSLAAACQVLERLPVAAGSGDPSNDPAADAAVAVHTDSLAARSFTARVVDMSRLADDGLGLVTGDTRITGTTTLLESDTCGNDSPASCTTLGTPQHLRIDGTADVRFDSPRHILGLHVSLTGSQLEPLQALEPSQGTGFAFDLPQFRVLATALDIAGNPGRTVRAIPAAATFRSTEVIGDWLWIDTHLLGPVHGLRLTVESPIDGLDWILVDNLTTSHDYVADDDYFAICLLPDTQKYAERPELHDIFHVQTFYLAEAMQREQLLFVSHLGDIVEHGHLESEWQFADEAMARLDGGVPYGIMIGNHDFQDWNEPQLGSPLFQQYFPPSRYEDQPWWGGRSADGLSSYQTFDTPLGTFLWLHLTVDSPPPTMDWVDEVIAAHPDMPTLVTTHVYLRENGRIPVSYMSGTNPSWNGISADEVFARLAVHDQVFLIACGHIAAEHMQVSTNDHGNPVWEMLQDYQNRANGGEGFLRLLRFYPERDEIRAITYSPWLDTYEQDDDSRFTIDVDFSSRLP
jgi:hypothetical protein